MNEVLVNMCPCAHGYSHMWKLGVNRDVSSTFVLLRQDLLVNLKLSDLPKLAMTMATLTKEKLLR